MKLAYLGPPGTFSEEAARQYCRTPSALHHAQLVPVRTIHELLLAVDAGEYELGIVPVENSIEGPVVLTLDMLVHEVNLEIVGEEVLPVRHHLLVRPGVHQQEITRILSHPQALGQCRRTLGQILPQVDFVASSSTAEAARQVAASTEPWAAIGTSLAADLYGLQVAYEGVQDLAENMTRFLIVGKEKAKRTGFDKTSAVFAFGHDRPGNLYAALREFAVREINLTKLESRPAKRSLGDYIFFVDMEGHRDDQLIAEALDQLNGLCSFVRILGSYPRRKYPRTNGGTDRASKLTVVTPDVQPSD